MKRFLKVLVQDIELAIAVPPKEKQRADEGEGDEVVFTVGGTKKARFVHNRKTNEAASYRLGNIKHNNNLFAALIFWVGVGIAGYSGKTDHRNFSWQSGQTPISL